jgi:chromosome segregation ATPase
MNEEDVKESESTETAPTNPVLLKRSKRSTVRLALRAERSKLKELEQRMSEGRDLSDDIDSCKGEIELLFKELQSIEDGGHTTFLEAKKLIAPKKNISAKKEFLREKMSTVQSEISTLQERLETPGIDPDKISETIELISKNEHTLSGLMDELQALKNFNHTRFVSAREEDRTSKELYTKLEQIDLDLLKISDQLIEAAQHSNYELIESLNNKAIEFKKQKEELLYGVEESSSENDDIEYTEG